MGDSVPYREVFEQAEEAIFLLDHQGTVLHSNAASERLLGRKPAPAESLATMFPEGDPAILGRLLAGPRPSESVTYRLDLGEGEVRRVSGHLKRVDVEDGSAIFRLSLGDTTERARLERERDEVLRREREQRALLEALMENAPDFVMHIDAEGKIRFINKILDGYDPNEVIGAPWENFVLPEYRERHRVALAQVFGEGRSVSFETEGPGPNGPARYLSRVGPVRTEGRVAGAVLVSTDITEQKKTEEQLLFADRMATVGTLAAGVAHEINNPLVAVSTNLELAFRDPGHGGRAPEPA